ncbi:RNA polymerase factor sigma-70 [Tepidimonas taiwanensis]|uniref:ECF RNA polymerase sigma factor SigG n=1 Tax=Tepidimonas taiwanensis TaxID=307486 RepID=A0A554WZ49_9BURK|nr:RNA polymerase factor sigma-70 [Tepidimonas taiwanensis]MCX7742397.1 RNA polymerase factor sigma-70 [Tepidimonas sp.]TSE28856.1 ECF RNA polymerase sigma factor SigG [Tepidimonas taiwanensis]UBQ05203.1 RNA polymerase factor sigma-70 [Tepidimonas taiwanensis]
MIPEKPSVPFEGAFLDELRRQMLHFATLQLSDAHAAEDAVQEALIGAMQNAGSFAGRAAFKTWVFAILKNKIADELRRRQRSVNVGSLAFADEDDEDLHELFDRRGYWEADERPQHWADPEGALHDAQFWRVFDACLAHLPPKQARVFMMREFLELETPEICASVGLTVSNLHVMLHRARLRLRECLENHWFAGDPR